MTSPLRTILYGTGTNYLRVFVRMGGGIITFRLLIQSLSQQDFGFYQLLWATIGYAVLLDFGLGMSARKTMALGVERDDEQTLQLRREVISTTFFGYLAIDVLLGLILLLSGKHLLAFLAFDTASAWTRYRSVAAIFACGMLAAFPLGIFREALYGLGRIHVVNLVETPLAICSTLLVAWACLSHWSLEALTAVSVAGTVTPAAVVMVIACLSREELRPRLRHVRLGRLPALGSFSLAVYIISMTGLILGQSDQLVISTMLSVDAIAVYVPGFKLMGFYVAMAAQMQSTLGPVAARFAGMADPALKAERLSTLLLNGQRWSMMIGTLLVIPLLADMPGALALLTGRPSPSPEMTHTALLLVGSAWLGVCVTSCSKGILMMVGRHVVMLGFSGAEAALNLSLSILLTLRWRSPAGTAAGTLIAALLISVVGVPVFASRALGLPSRSFITASARGLAANAGAAASAILWWIAVPVFHPTWHFLIGGALCVAAALPGWWFLGMLPPERTRAAAFLLKSAPVKLIARR